MRNMNNLKSSRAVVVVTLLFVLCTRALQAQNDLSLEKGLQDLATSLSTSMKTSSIRKIAIVEFTDLSGYPSVLGQFIAEELITALLNVSPGQFDIVERRQLAKVLKEQKLSASGLIDSETIASVGKLLGIQAIVTGSITDLGSGVKLNARVIAVESGKVFAASSVRVAKDSTTERLLNQSAVLESSSALPDGPRGANRHQQASDVFFQNTFLRVEVRSFAVRSDKKSVAFALRVKNLTGNDLYLGINAARQGSGPMLVSDKGFHGEVWNVRGLGIIDTIFESNAADKKKYTVLSPGGETTVTLTYDTPFEIAGNVFAFSAEFFRYTGADQWVRFTVGISNIEPR
jgi:TolB-like protein